MAWTTSGETKSCPAGPKIASQGIGVIVPGRRHQGIDGFLRRSEGLFIRRRHTHRQRQRQERQAGPDTCTTTSGATMKGRSGFIGGNVCVGIMGLNGSMLWLGI